MKLPIKNGKWLIGVSGGPDSMALLNMCYEEGLKIGVAHVNYHHRDTADRDMQIVETYCFKRQIPFYCLNTEYDSKGNFQSFARKWRYDFFKNIVDEFDYDGLLIAHQQDDVLETYIMQDKKNLVPETYGLAQSISYQGMLVVRPLLNKTKKQLEKYCQDNSIKYGIDESNLTNDYTRNVVRHTTVEKMSLATRKELLKEIDRKNSERKLLEKQYENIVLNGKLNLKAYAAYDIEERVFLLRRYFKVNKLKEASRSKKYFIELDGVLLSKKDVLLPFKDKQLLKHQQVCEIVGNTDKSYSYALKSLKALKTPYFEVAFKGKSVEAVTVFESDLALTIRSVLPGDKIKLRLGSKKIHRWFIDRHIDLHQRHLWPVVVNRSNQVILVPGIGCDVEHFTTKPNMFVLKY